MQTTSPTTTLAPAPDPAYALQARGMTKRFPGVLANDHIDLDLLPGEIHAPLGENGAGKSTLMNVLYGLYRPDAGTIRLRGADAGIRSPRDAIARGIGMIHQHFMLIPPLTVAENVVLGDERSGPLLREDRLAARVRELEERFHIGVDPDARVEDLPLGLQQRVEILKVLYRGSELLIFDEPTAVLTPLEVDELFGIVRTLRDDGKTLILITHKLREVMAVTDRITVLRGGQNAGELVTRNTNPSEIARAMVGRELKELKARATPPRTDVVLEVRGLEARSDRGSPELRGVEFEVHAGEILGVAGVGGNGQSELAQCILGLRRPSAGAIRIGNVDISKDDPKRTRARGVAYVPEDRHLEGLVLAFTVADDFILGKQDRGPFARHGLLDPVTILRNGGRLAAEYDVRPPNPRAIVANLSGRNQPKVVLGRELSERPKLIVVSQPTRGLDIAATEYVHERLLEQRGQGAAVLPVSGALDEIRALSDRIAVMFEGRIVATLDAASATEERLGLLMAGHGEAAA